MLRQYTIVTLNTKIHYSTLNFDILIKQFLWYLDSTVKFDKFKKKILVVLRQYTER
jgi:hypothetical protein